MDFRNGCFDHKTFNAYNESIVNANKSRNNWMQKYEKVIKKFPNKNLYTWRGMFDLVDLEDAKNEKFKLPDLTPPPRKIDYKKEANEYLQQIGAKDAELKLIPGECYPLNPQTEELLYRTNFSNRKDYLRERGKLAPEKRYKFPMSTSMEYGWRISQSEKSITNKNKNVFPEFGMRNAIITTLYRNNGVFNL